MTEIHEILKNKRRQYILEYLCEEAPGVVSVRELSARIAELETGETPPASKRRESVYVSLHQSHLPKLDEAGFIDYDIRAKTVLLQDHGQEIWRKIYKRPQYTRAWGIFYTVVTLVGLFLIVGAEIGLPGLGSVPKEPLAILIFLIIAAAGLYQRAHWSSQPFQGT